MKWKTQRYYSGNIIRITCIVIFKSTYKKNRRKYRVLTEKKKKQYSYRSKTQKKKKLAREDMKKRQ